MIPVEQSILRHDPDNGVYGDCFSATIASLLHIPLKSIPIFKGDRWLSDFNKWLGQYGMAFVIVYTEDKDWWKIVGLKNVWHECAGMSPRNDGIYHATVGYDGECVFDPHKYGKGIKGNVEYGFFVVKEPWKYANQIISISRDCDACGGMSGCSDCGGPGIRYGLL